MKQYIFSALLVLAGLSARPQAVINVGQTVEINSLTDAAGGANLQYRWMVSKDGAPEAEVENATSASYTTPPALEAGSYAYRRVAYSTECSAGAYTAPFTVLVQSCYSFPTVAAVSSGAFCSGAGASLSASASAGAVIDWYADTIGSGSNVPLLMGSASYYTPPLTEATSYWAQARSTADGCVSTARARVTTSLSPTPGSPAVTAGAACSGGSATLKATAGTSGTTCRWYEAGSGGSLLVQDATYFTPDITVATTYHVSSYNAATGCESAARTPVTASINALPTITSATGDAVCSGNAATLSVVTGTGVARWYSDSASTVILSQSAAYITPAISAFPTSYSVAAYSAATGCESERQTVNVTASTNVPVAAASLLTTNGLIAVRTTATGGTPPYTYASGSGSNYSINPIVVVGGGTVTTTPGTAATAYTATTTTIKVRDSKGCISAAVGTPPTLNMPAIPSGTTYCAGCAYEGGVAEVDLWIGANTTGPLLTTDHPGGSLFSLNDGRTNSQRINALATKGTGFTACLAKGTNWYVPAYGEGRKGGARFDVASNSVTCSTVATTGVSWPDGMMWNPGEPNDGGTSGESCIVQKWTTGSGNDISCPTVASVLCAWRP